MEKNILTNEEKVYLKRVSNYLRSLGVDEGVINIDIQDSYIEDINWDWVSHFDNRYGAEIPEGLKPILKKLTDYVVENVYEEPGVDYVDYESLDIRIDAIQKEILFNRYYSYTQAGSEDYTDWSMESDPEDIEFVFSGLSQLKSDPNGTLVLRYNGSGDSGYLEGRFDDGSEVPSAVEEWSYNKLSLNYGGWENNEGSEGYFEFDRKLKEIRLYHTYNEQITEDDDLLLLKF
jgi:hypothetical protein